MPVEFAGTVVCAPLPTIVTFRGVSVAVTLTNQYGLNDDESLARELDDVIARHRTDIAHILDAYGVPRVEGF